MTKPELRWELGGPRNYLDGKPMHAGEILEVELSDGSWTTARYEYSWNKREGEFQAYFLISKAGSDDEEVVLRAESIPCRWPGR